MKKFVALLLSFAVMTIGLAGCNQPAQKKAPTPPPAEEKKADEKKAEEKKADEKKADEKK